MATQLGNIYKILIFNPDPKDEGSLCDGCDPIKNPHCNLCLGA
jgi:hypothetical protein